MTDIKTAVTPEQNKQLTSLGLTKEIADRNPDIISEYQKRVAAVDAKWATGGEIAPETLALADNDVGFFGKLSNTVTQMGYDYERGNLQLENANIKLKEFYPDVFGGAPTQEELTRYQRNINVMGALTPQNQNKLEHDVSAMISNIPMQINVYKHGIVGAVTGAGAGALAGFGLGAARGLIGGPEGALVAGGVGAAFGARKGKSLGWDAGQWFGNFKQQLGFTIEQLDAVRGKSGEKLDRDIMSGAAIFSSAINATIEQKTDDIVLKKIPAPSKIAKYFGREQLPALMMKPAFRQAFAKIGKDFAKGYTIEGSTEVIQNLITTIGQEVAKLQSSGEFDAITPEQLREDAIDTFTTAGFGGGFIHGTVSTAQQVVDARNFAKKTKSGEAAAAQAAGLHQIVPTSKLYQNSPETLKNEVNRMTGNASWYIDPEVLAAQLDTLTPEQQSKMSPVLTSLRERVADALQTGADVEINKGDYAAYIAPHDTNNILVDHLKDTIDGFSKFETKSFLDMQRQNPELAAPILRADQPDLQSTYQEQRTAIERMYQKALEDSGMTKIEARTNAKLYAASQVKWSSAFGENAIAAAVRNAPVFQTTQGGQKIASGNVFTRLVSDLQKLNDGKAGGMDSANKFAATDLKARIEAAGTTLEAVVGMQPDEAINLLYGQETPSNQQAQDVKPITLDQAAQNTDAPSQPMQAKEQTQAVETKPVEQVKRAKVKPERQTAQAYDVMPFNDINNPVVDAAFKSLSQEVLALYGQNPSKRIGKTIQRTPDSAYAVADEAINPLYAITDFVDANGTPLRVYDLVRQIAGKNWKAASSKIKDPMAKWAFVSTMAARAAAMKQNSTLLTDTPMNKKEPLIKLALLPHGLSFSGIKDAPKPSGIDGAALAGSISQYQADELDGIEENNARQVLKNQPFSAVKDNDGVASIPETIEVDGTQRNTRNSKGDVIAQTEEGIKNFWRWFGDSKVVDEQGKPLVVYHGTRTKFASFVSGAKQENASGSNGIFFTDNHDVASSYSGSADDALISEQGVHEVYLKLYHPLNIDAHGSDWASLDKPYIWVIRDESGEIINTYQYEKDAEVFFNDYNDNFVEEYGIEPNEYGKITLTKEIDQEAVGVTTDELFYRAIEEGKDGVIVTNVLDVTGEGASFLTDPSTVYIVEKPTQIKSVSNTGAFNQNDARILYQAEPLYSGDFIDIDGVQKPTTNSNGQKIAQTESGLRNFWAWFGNSKAVDEDGKPITLYHGTTADFEAFDTSKGNVGSDLGAGIYFTNNAEDVASNYAGFGPDLTNKIQLQAERIASETDREYDDADVIEEARSLYVQHEGMTIPVYFQSKNPVIIGSNDETFFDFEYPYDEQTDENGEPQGKLVDFIEAIKELADEYNDVDAEKAASILYEVGIDGGIKASDLMHYLKDRPTGIEYATDENGEVASNELIRRAFERIGFDSIIDNTVNKKFGSERVRGKSMAGMDYTTVHYVAFNGTQAKALFNNGSFNPNDPRILYQLDGRLRSALLTAAKVMKQPKGSGAQMLGILRNVAGVKEEEIAWTGLDDYLKEKDSVTKQDIVNYLEENQVQLEEKTLSSGSKRLTYSEAISAINDGIDVFYYDPSKQTEDEANGPIDVADVEALSNGNSVFVTQQSVNETRYSRYTLPNGENYREVLLTFPQFVEYKSSHFDQKNILAHTRLTDRTDADGKKVLFIEEIQSDWHQAGRKKGYNVEAYRSADEARYQELVQEGRRNLSGEALMEFEALIRRRDVAKSGVPDAPFKKTWHEMVFRRVTQMAAQGGYDRIAWTTGEQQAERFDLSKNVNLISATKNKDGTYLVYIEGSDGSPLFRNQNGFSDNGQKSMSQSQIDELIGTPLSKKLLDGADKSGDKWFDLKDTNLKVGGEGMKGFYDKILVDYAKKFGKKYGSPVGETKVEIGGGKPTQYENYDAWAAAKNGKQVNVHSMDITDAMRQSAIEGFELFQRERGSIEYTQSTLDHALKNVIVSFTESRNKTTPPHEFSHYAVAMHRMYVERARNAENDGSATEATRKIIEDWDKLKKYVGAVDDVFTVEQEEKIAQTFERYMYSGHVPSEYLRSAMVRFRDWFVTLYKNLREMNVDIAPEVRDVFDNWLAAEDEIATVRNKSAAFTSIAKNLGLDQSIVDRMANYVVGAVGEAEDILFRKLEADRKARETKKYEDEYARIEKELRPKIEAEPQYAAVDYMRKNNLVFLDGPEMDGLPSDIIHREGDGKTVVHPDQVAELLGAESGRKLVKLIVDAPNIENRLGRDVREAIKAEFPEQVEGKRISEAARTALYNDRTLLAIDLLVRELTKGQSNARNFSMKKFAEFVAVQNIMKLPLADANKIEKFDRARDKNIRDALIASQSGDVELALLRLQQAMIAHTQFRLLQEFRNQRKKDDAFLSKLSDSDEKLAKSRDIDLLNAARALGVKFGLLEPSAGVPSFDAWFNEVSDFDNEEYEDIRDDVLLLSDMTGEVSDGLLQGNARITIEEYQNVMNKIRFIETWARDKKTTYLNGVKVQVEAVAGELISTLDIDNPLRVKQTGAGRIRKGIEGFETQHASKTRMIDWVRRVSKGEEKTPWREYILKPVNDAYGKYLKARQPVMENLLSVFDKYKDRIDIAGRIQAPFMQKRSNGEYIPFYFADRRELLGFILHMGNPSNFEKLCGGLRLDETHVLDGINQMMKDGTLIERDIDFIQELWDLIGSLKSDAQATHKKVFGYKFIEIQPQPFVTPWKTYEGGYWPSQVDFEQIPQGDAKTIIEEAKQVSTISIARGFTIKRTNQKTLPVEYSLRLATKHIDGVVRFVHMTEAVRFAARILRRKDLSERLQEYDKDAMNQIIVPWIRRTMKNTADLRIDKANKSEAFLERVVKYATKQVSRQLMAFNIGVLLQNATSFPAVVREVGARNVARAHIVFGKSPSAALGFIKESSDYMFGRLEIADQKIGLQIDHIINDRLPVTVAGDYVGYAASVTANMFDNYVAGVTWLAAYNKATESAMAHTDAVTFADETVKRTQGSRAPNDISLAQQGGPAKQFFQAFMDFFNAQYSQVTTRLGNEAEQKRYGAMMATITMSVVAPALLGSILIKALRGQLPEDDDEDGYVLDDYLQWAVVENVKYVAMMFFIGGQLLIAGLNQLDKNPINDRYSITPVTGLIDTIFKTIKDVSSDKDVDNSSLVKRAAISIGALSGIPLGQLSNPVAYAADVAEGDSTNQGPLDVVRGAIFGPAPSK